MVTKGQSEQDPNQSLPIANLIISKHQSRETTLKYAAIAAVIAGIIGLQPWPGISRLILPFVEVGLLMRISNIYCQPLSKMHSLAIFGVLFFCGGIIGTIIDTLLIPFIGVGAIPKALIAAGIVYGLGEAANHYYNNHHSHRG